MALYLNENGETAEDDQFMRCAECGHGLDLHEPAGCPVMLLREARKCPCSYREVPCGQPLP